MVVSSHSIWCNVLPSDFSMDSTDEGGFRLNNLAGFVFGHCLLNVRHFLSSECPFETFASVKTTGTVWDLLGQGGLAKRAHVTWWSFSRCCLQADPEFGQERFVTQT